ncbi:MAG: hypothetical protein HY600_02120 [Candidatus Omnitrophica bacterium]|nr:hypothetical protein [Candidatus Omnitrophota bacterium]
MTGDGYWRAGLSDLPRLIESCDRDPFSPTYGCFDRGYWHYRTSEFPSGMFQEAVLALAIAYRTDRPENPYHQQARVRELVGAGIRFAAKASHADGSCDDYFPYERAAGAAAFSLYACTEAHRLLDLPVDAITLDFFKRRGRYLARTGSRESGTLSNHLALMALALRNVVLLTRDPWFERQSNRLLDRVLALQDPEGWFPEYEGCDPGYLSFTIDFLAKLGQKGVDRVREPVTNAIRFAAHFMHPDGSYGGEYGSRNTCHVLPHGLELMARHVPEAARMSERHLERLARGMPKGVQDDRGFAHYSANLLQAACDWTVDRSAGTLPCEQAIERYFPRAGLWVAGDGHDYAVVSTRKGGVAKVFRRGVLAHADCGITGRTQAGARFTSQIAGASSYRQEGPMRIIEGGCAVHRDLRFSPETQFAFRAFLLVVGRFLPANATRRWLQELGILPRRRQMPLRYRKCFVGAVPTAVKWEFWLDDRWTRLKTLAVMSSATYMYVATSRPYQPSDLYPWRDLSHLLPALNERRHASCEYPLP